MSTEIREDLTTTELDQIRHAATQAILEDLEASREFRAGVAIGYVSKLSLEEMLDTIAGDCTEILTGILGFNPYEEESDD